MLSLFVIGLKVGFVEVGGLEHEHKAKQLHRKITARQPNNHNGKNDQEIKTAKQG